MAEAALEGVVLDHVAHAVPRWQDAWRRYAVDLGARWSSGGESVGFAPAQLRFGNDARIELLMPHDPDANDFLRRFLARHGPGAHHLTFKVPSLADALDSASRSGYQPINIDLSDPLWMEAFLHPKQATGIVVQLAEAPAGWDSPAPADFPRERRRHADGSGHVPAASLERVVHLVADHADAARLFVGLLGGETVDHGDTPEGRWTDVTWGGALVLRLVAPVADRASAPVLQWLGGRTGRVHHLGLTTEDPGSLEGARTLEADTSPAWLGRRAASVEIAPEENVGLRLVLAPPR